MSYVYSPVNVWLVKVIANILPDLKKRTYSLSGCMAVHAESIMPIIRIRTQEIFMYYSTIVSDALLHVSNVFLKISIK